MAVNINDAFYEDDNGNIYMFYTGRKNVLGLQQPDSYIVNENRYNYARVAFLAFENDLLDTEEVYIDETFNVVLDGVHGNLDYSEIVQINVRGLYKAGHPVVNTFRCVVGPQLDTTKIPEVFVTEERVTRNGVSFAGVGIWVEISGTNRVFTQLVHSKAKNSVAPNEDVLDSKYYIDMLQNADINSTNTSNVRSTLVTLAVCEGVNLYHNMNARLDNLEAIAIPRFQYCHAKYSSIFVAANNNGYQTINPERFDYEQMVTSQFTNINASRDSFSVIESGTYQIQITTGIKAKVPQGNNNMVELSVFVDDLQLPLTVIRKSLDDASIVSSATTVYDLRPIHKVRLKLRFLDGTETVDNLDTYLSLLRIY